jgi:hypothetical protein
MDSRVTCRASNAADGKRIIFVFARRYMHDGDMIFRKENLAIDSSNRIP